MPTALVIDGAYFLRRFKWSFPTLDATDPQQVAGAVRWMAFWHLAVRLTPSQMGKAIKEIGFQPEESADLYRIFFYDCPPLIKRMHRPLSKRSIEFGRTPEAVFRLGLHAELQKVRKVAIRLGKLSDSSEWRLKAAATKLLIADAVSFSPTDDDFEIDTKQKGVDMRLGLDVAAMAFKGQVDQIVMVAADADFVPAAKLARREGIDVVLDPMGGAPAKDLLDHSDGVRNCQMPRLPLRDI